MKTSNLVLVEHYCSNCGIEFSFVHSLFDLGLIDIIVLDDEKYISNDQLKLVERAYSFHYDLAINIEGIDVIFNLLKQIEDLQEELGVAKNKLDALGL